MNGTWQVMHRSFSYMEFIVKKVRQMNTEKRKNIFRLIFGVYILGVLSITFVVRETMALRLPNSRGVALEPFREYQAMIAEPNHFYWFMQIFLNILLFVPFGFLLPLVKERGHSIWKVTIAGFAFSCAIELMQFITERGFTEIDDIINNSIGAFVGYLMYIVISSFFRCCREY